RFDRRPCGELQPRRRARADRDPARGLPAAGLDPEGARSHPRGAAPAPARADRLGADHAPRPGVAGGPDFPPKLSALLEFPVLDAFLRVLDGPSERLDLVPRFVGGLEVLALAGLEARGGERDHLVGRLLFRGAAEDPEDVAEALEEIDRLLRRVAGEALVD